MFQLNAWFSSQFKCFVSDSTDIQVHAIFFTKDRLSYTLFLFTGRRAVCLYVYFVKFHFPKLSASLATELHNIVKKEWVRIPLAYV